MLEIFENISSVRFFLRHSVELPCTQHLWFKYRVRRTKCFVAVHAVLERYRVVQCPCVNTGSSSILALSCDLLLTT